MGRNKQTPKKISHSITIVGAAAHSIWADDKDYYKEAYGQDVAASAKPTKRKLVTPEKNDEDDDNDVVFDNQSASAPRNLFGVKDDTNKNIHVVDKKRRIINDDDDDCDDTDKETNGLQLSSNDYSIIDGTPSSNAFELISFQLNINITLKSGGNNDIRKTSIVLESEEAVETILKFCNQSLDSTDDNLDIDHIIRASREGMLNIIVTLSDEGKVDVSIRLLLNPCLEKLSNSSSSPPIAVPRRQPGLRQRFTQPTPSYTLIQALGAIFKQSVFDNVAETLLNKQYNLDQKNTLITAKDVYSQVDNAHYEFAGSEASTSLDIPGLLPTLRPYQSAAVQWMLKCEEEIPSTESDEWELCWFVITECQNTRLDEAEGSGVARTSNILPLVEWKLLKSSPTERCLLVNPFNGELANTHDEAKAIMLGDEDNDNTHVRGGILAESMGLGKTVEVLACIIANQAPSTLQSPSPGTHVYRGDPLIPTSHSTTKPSILHDATCICGRSTSYRDCLSWVVCKDCGEEMHGRCAGFTCENELVTTTEYDSNSAIRVCSCNYCPTCAATKPAIKSRATLIVTPPSILSQWEREISRHTKMPETGRPLKVVVYPGIRELCKSGAASPHDDFHLVHPRHLANADIVLCTFQTLMTDLGHSDDNPFAFAKDRSSLRSRKRYGVLPSPLICIEWWRVCLDEAQRVEAPTSTSARMAHKLKTNRRWCVSGTPIGRGKLDDLYGLLLFLSFKPFDNKQWFLTSFIPSQGDALQRLAHLLRHILWRSTKANALVRQQMGIPEQEEKKVKVQFSKLEEYFYKKQYEETSRAVNSWSQRKGSTMLSNSLQKLRAACCHPQVGASGVGSARSNVVLSMDQVRSM